MVWFDMDSKNLFSIQGESAASPSQTVGLESPEKKEKPNPWEGFMDNRPSTVTAEEREASARELKGWEKKVNPAFELVHNAVLLAVGGASGQWFLVTLAADGIVTNIKALAGVGDNKTGLNQAIYEVTGDQELADTIEGGIHLGYGIYGIGRASIGALRQSPALANNAIKAVEAAKTPQVTLNATKATSETAKAAEAVKASEVPKGTSKPLTVNDFAKVNPKLSVQKQHRHLAGRKELEHGGYMNSIEDAQQVLNAYHSGEASIIGANRHGFPIVRYNNVTGINVNKGANITGEPTNIFMIKGTTSPSVVPMDPRRGL